MISFYLRKMSSSIIMVTAIFCFASSEKLVAAANVTYTVSGVFSGVISGNDLFDLNGEPFSFSVVASSTAQPSKFGTNYAVYTPLPMMATVTSGLLPTPIMLSNQFTSMLLAIGGTGDLFVAVSPLKVFVETLTFKVAIPMPLSTITKLRVYPFAAPIALVPGTATLTYSDMTNTTVLGMTGTLNATVAAGTGAETDAAAAKSSPVLLYAAGAQTITRHADGTQSLRSAHGSAVDLGVSADKVALQFYASGVRDASQVRMQIAGEDVAVLYAGPAGHFAGLDQVSVQLPPSLAGRGDTDAVLTVDGRTAGPVRIHLQ